LIVLTRHVERQWTVPGGHLEPGESPLDAITARRARRLVYDSDPPGLSPTNVHIETAPGERLDPRYPNPGFQVFYVAEMLESGAITALEECSEARSFSPDEARAAPGWVQEHGDLYEIARARRATRRDR
jgi:8-oxo-dGTP diphosphatase